MDAADVVSMKRRLGMACARGYRQGSLVNELLAGPVAVKVNPFNHVEVGLSKVQWASFKNLRDRLVEIGFVILVENDIITMIFPEEGKKND